MLPRLLGPRSRERGAALPPGPPSGGSRTRRRSGRRLRGRGFEKPFRGGPGPPVRIVAATRSARGRLGAGRRGRIATPGGSPRMARGRSQGGDLAYRRKGQRLLDLGRPKEAIAAFDAALGLRPSDSEAWLDAARAWQALGQTARARKMLDEAIRLDPQNVEAQRLRSEGTVAD